MNETILQWQAVNNEIRSTEDCRLPAASESVLYGASVFETLRTYGGRLPFWDRHTERLLRGAQILGIPRPDNLDAVPETIVRLLEYNGLTEARVRITLGTESHLAPILFINVSRLTTNKPPAHAVLADFPRNEDSPLVNIKSGNYLELLIAWRKAKASGHDEVIFLNTKGCLCEGSRTNLFIFSEGRLLTPGLHCGLLPGITRAIVMEESQKMGIETNECNLIPDQLLNCSEAFLTNSVDGVRPLGSIGTKKIGAVKPGEMTCKLAENYEKRASRSAESTVNKQE